MTDTPHIEALAMRTAAADEVLSVELGFYDGIGGDWHPHDRKDLMQHAASAILALPLEADPAALVAEALRLPEVRALVETMAGLKRIVEEIDGAMNHGTWRDEKGMRLKDTPEWVSAYAALAAIKEPKT